MATHDYSLANASGAAFRSDLNDVLSAIVTWNSATADPATMFARMRHVRTDVGVVKRRNAANSGWIVESTDDEARYVARASNTMLDVSDITKLFRATASFTQTLDAAATLGDGWWCAYRIESAWSIVFDPNAAETIDGAATLTIIGPASGYIFCTGTTFYTMGFFGGLASNIVNGAFTANGNVTLGDGADTLALATNNMQTPGSNGEITYPVQPCVLALAALQSNVTGDNTDYTLQFTTEIADRNADFDGTSTFTAPSGCTGLYRFSLVLYASGWSDHTRMVVTLVTSNRTYTLFYCDALATAFPGEAAQTWSCLADMDAADTAVIKVKVSGGSATKVVDIPATTTYLSVQLAG